MGKIKNNDKQIVKITNNIVKELNTFRDGKITKEELMNKHSDLLIKNNFNENKTISLMVRILSIPEGDKFEFELNSIVIEIINLNGKYKTILRRK